MTASENSNNRGAALVTVLFAVTLAALLASSLIWLVSFNNKTKVNDYTEELAFYDVDAVAEAVKADVYRQVSGVTYSGFNSSFPNGVTVCLSDIENALFASTDTITVEAEVIDESTGKTYITLVKDDDASGDNLVVLERLSISRDGSEEGNDSRKTFAADIAVTFLNNTVNVEFRNISIY